MTDDDREGFLSRWSRRKLERDAALESTPESSSDEPFAGFDFDALDFGSDYRQFMAANVPDSVRNLALQKLWSSSDIISQPDELDDYLEDFREQAKALAPNLARSAYVVGRGIADEKPAEPEAVETTAKDETRSAEKSPDKAGRPDKADRAIEPDKPT